MPKLQAEVSLDLVLYLKACHRVSLRDQMYRNRDLLPKVHGAKNPPKRPSRKSVSFTATGPPVPPSLEPGTLMPKNVFEKMRSKCKFWQTVVLFMVGVFIYFMFRENGFQSFSTHPDALLPRLKIFQSVRDKELGNIDIDQFDNRDEEKPSDVAGQAKKKDNQGERWRRLACVPLKSAVTDTRICIYPPNEDTTVSTALLYNGTWDAKILEDFKLALTLNPRLGLIDIGANLGTYSLTAASMDRQVLAVEASHYTALRLKRSIEINGYHDKISLVEAAVMPTRGYVRMFVPQGNAAGAYAQPVDEDSITQNDSRRHVISKAVILDDIIPYVKFRRAILKIDIAGNEYSLFQQAKQLFDVHDIPYVYVFFSSEEGETIGKSLGVQFLTKRGYSPKRSFRDKTSFFLTQGDEMPCHLVWVKGKRKTVVS